MKVLVINSDLAANRGDRAIAAGLLGLVRDTFPGARVTIVSQHATRDGAWFDAEALGQDIHSLSPLALVSLMRAARRADLVLWGGGELLKDYTNRLGVWYWAVKIAAVRAANRNLVGAFQGIGPTSARSSRRLIAATVRRTKTFLTRDEESRDKLVAWGVPAERVTASFDCAVYATDLEPVDLPAERYAIVAPREWFHYRKGGWLPHRWRRERPQPDADLLATRLVEAIDALVEAHGAVVLAPMHMVQDPAFAHRLRERAAHPERVHVLDDDEVSPGQIRSVYAAADVMIALRLHAGIVASSVGVPTVTYFYVDKGRLYADQVGAAGYTRPIERLLEDDAVADLTHLASAVVTDAAQAERTAAALAAMRERLRADFAAAVGR
ncbi:polysaccharide pyruvyl transferase family protein [Demequina sp. NBRC 110057]|uniref:polysaccharide pyruvyl transferase family protein n=1 Tax=Demequina sp. NBRC 110057 TaxID=1570346 RepID=UPI00135661C5|nr:polysaccharide pyruvyl transferase family protein [Demequina sp. NBRC 110057]